MNRGFTDRWVLNDKMTGLHEDGHVGGLRPDTFHFAHLTGKTPKVALIRGGLDNGAFNRGIAAFHRRRMITVSHGIGGTDFLGAAVGDIDNPTRLQDFVLVHSDKGLTINSFLAGNLLIVIADVDSIGL